VNIGTNLTGPQALDDQQMRQPKAACGRVFQGIGDAAQDAPQPGAARGEFIVAGVDLAVIDHAHRQAIEQAAQAGRGVRTHVRRQAVAQRVRQVIDERGVAEMVAASPVMAVGLERVKAVGCKNDGAAA